MKQTGRWLGVSLAAIVLLLVVLFGLAQTGAGKRQLSALAGTLLSQGRDVTVRLGKLEGLVPFDFRLDRLSVSDKDGVWLEVTGATVRWSVADLLWGRIHIATLGAAAIELTRPPQKGHKTKKTAETGPPEGLKWFQSLIVDRIAVNRIAVERLALGAQVLGEKAVFELKGQIMASAPACDRIFSLHIERIDGVTARVLSTAALKGDLPIIAQSNLFTLRGRLTHAGSIDIDRCMLETEAAVLQAVGSLDLKTKQARGNVTLRVDDLSGLQGLAGCELAGALVVEAKLSGAAFQPEVALFVKLEGLEVEKFQASRIEGNLDLSFLAPLAAPFPGLCISGNGAADGLAWQGAESLPETRLTWSVIAKGPVDDNISINKLEIAGKSFGLAASGRGSIADLAGKGEVTLDVHDLKHLSGFLGLELSGSTRFCATFEGDGKERAFSARIRGKTSISEQDDSPLAVVFAPEVVSAARIELKEGTKLTISDFLVEAPAGKLTAETSLDLSNRAVFGHWQLTLPQLGLLSDAVKSPVAGSLHADGEISGTLDMASLTASATGQELLVGMANFQQLGLTLSVDGLPARPVGHMTLDLRQGEHLILTEAGCVFKDRCLTFFPVSVQAPAGELTGRLALDTDTMLVCGSIDAACTDLSDLSGLVGKKLNGNVVLNMRFNPSGKDQNVEFRFKGTGLGAPFGHADEVKLTGSARDVYGTAQGTAQIKVKAFQGGNLTLATASLSASGDKKEIAFTGKAEGRYNTAFDMQAEGAIEVSAQGERLELTRFQGHYGDFPVSLLRPVTFQHALQRYSLDGLALNLGKGTLHASAKIGDEHAKITVNLEDLPLDALGPVGVPDLSGFMSGHLKATQEQGQVEGKVQLRLTEVRTAGSGSCRATVDVEAELHKERVSAILCLEGLAEKPAEATLNLPVVLSLVPFAFSVPPQVALEGHAAGEIDLARISSVLFPLEDQAVQGRFDVALDVAGTLAAPNMTGMAHLREGAYDNVCSGTILRDIDVKMAAKDSMLIVEKAIGGDGNSGVVSVSGQMDLSPDKGFPFQYNLFFKDATVCRFDELTVVTGGGLTLSGTPAEVLVAGKIEVNSAEMRIPDHSSREIAELEIIEINRKSKQTKEKPVRQHTSSRKLLFDVALESPARIFLRGRGLESEWKGAIGIGGDTHQPVITGDLSVLRGHFDLLGKRFLLKQGLVSFYGAVPPAPFLDVTGEATNGEITAFLQVSGPISALELSLSSEPPLPTDEIISRLLFGRAVSEITPIEGLQLAYAVNTLAGGQGGWDVMGYTRDLLGVDHLDVKQSDDENSELTVGAGMYLNRHVYLELERGLSPGSGKGTVQVEITPDVTIETEIGGELDAGIGIRWKRDY